MTLYRIHKDRGHVYVLDDNGWRRLPGSLSDVLPSSFASAAKPDQVGQTDVYRYIVTREP